MKSVSLSRLSDSLGTRASRAVLSLFALRSDPLREELRRRFAQAPGGDGSFLSDPVVEAAFGYEQSSRKISELAGELLTPALVHALDDPGKAFREQRFPASQHPYAHQVEAWRSARDPGKRGFIVSSGTGSGKTECFLVPILDDLLRESAAQRRHRLVGTRALFLYPLNALINSQRERLSAWTRGLRGDVRFCLFNGETKEEVPAHLQNASPEQVLSRKLMREAPAPLLVTNATMLEYMLVRQDDAPILAKSQGLLRWIVIDEAHTYVGSQAAELAMLMRRVMHAFGVTPAQVKFIATSATLGGDGAAGIKALAQFVADLAGTKPEQVDVITGRRFVPPLDDYAKRDEPVDLPLRSILPADELYERLASSSWFRGVRQYIAAGARTLTDLTQYARAGAPDALGPTELLGFLDAASLAQKGEERLLPLRVHFFHRTQRGVWVCVNPKCVSRAGTALDVPAWPFGGLRLERRETCRDCEALVLELVRCSECGSAFLLSSEEARGLDRFITARQNTRSEHEEEFDLVEIEGESEEGEAGEPEEAIPTGFVQKRLLATELLEHEGARYVIDPWSGEVLDDDAAGVQASVLLPEDGRFVCTFCGKREKVSGRLFRSMLAGAPFLLNVAIPTLLEHTPPLNAEQPMEGRRLITFSDSRQGTARFAISSQLEADRNHARSVIYHQLLASRRAAAPDTARLEEEIRELKKVASNPVFAGMLAEKKRQVEAAKAGVLQPVPWSVLGEEIQHDTAIRVWAAEMWDEVSYGDIRGDVGDFYLLREFARRARRENTLETMGLVALSYPDIDRLPEHRTPAAWRDRGGSPAEWRGFLTAVMDHLVRSRSAVESTREFVNWIGSQLWTHYVLPPLQEPQHHRVQVRWPTARTPRAVLPSLLAHGFHLDLDDRDDRTVVDLLLEQAWQAVEPLLKRLPDGYVLPMKERVAFKPVEKAFRCPITGRVLANTFRGLSPYALSTREGAGREASPVILPVVPAAWWQERSGRTWTPDEIRDWLENTPEVVQLRAIGVWSDLHDRILAGAQFFRVVEHSAQQESARLLDYEARFKQGRVNVLSCSTTMEMGVDIGGVSAVAMNNAPPGPANFLQRAGRAGRRQEATTATLTLCRADPHGEAVFRNPLWPFTTPIYVPRVSLDSDTVVQRHVNAFLLGVWFRSTRADAHRLTTGWFFNDGHSPSPATHFLTWVRQNAAERLGDDLATLLRQTRLEPNTVLDKTVAALKALADDWGREVTALNEQIAMFKGEGERETPAQMAASRQRERLVDEYLLRELSARGFLPAHGFPSNVIPFIPTTFKQLRQERRARRDGSERGREDVGARRRGYPSRELQVGIRDYAPGNQTVIDGRVYTSAGVILNWHIPPGDKPVRETQVFSQAWRCRRCGATGSTAVQLEECPGCHTSAELTAMTYLQPAGFAVDIGYQPHNRIDTSLYIPVEDPWITAGVADWNDFAHRLPIRIRSNTSGHVFHYSRGLEGLGFSVCLRCGRAESATARPGAALREHSRLRGGRDDSGQSRCEGNDQTWAIKSGIWLGASTTTDVFEMQFTDGLAVEEKAAFSLAVVLKTALAAKLGIEVRELGSGAVKARGDRNQRTHSVVLFDQAALGAGFATEAPNHLEALLSEAGGRLQCTCDHACHRCLLTYDTQYQIEKLDRLAALRLLGF